MFLQLAIFSYALAADCMAGDIVEEAFGKISAAVEDAETEMKSLEASNNTLVAMAAHIAEGALELAETWISGEDEPVPNTVCTTCAELETDFNKIKKHIKLAVGTFTANAKVTAIVDEILTKIDLVFASVCPAPTTTTVAPSVSLFDRLVAKIVTTAAPATTPAPAMTTSTPKPACITKADATITLNRLMQFLSTAPDHLQKMPLFSDAAALLTKALVAAEAYVAKEAPKILQLAGASCLACKKILVLFQNAKAPIMKVIAKLDAPVKMIAETLLNVMNVALTAECPTM